MTSPARATGLIAKQGIELLSSKTANGYKISIFLEELKQAYGLNYTYQFIDIGFAVNKQPWYLALNANGKIPLIVDHDNDDFVVNESLAIYLYLIRNFDSSNTFSFTSPNDISRAEQLLAWSAGEFTPAVGMTLQFYRWHPLVHKVVDHYAINKYNTETQRCLGVLDRALEGRDYLVGEGKGKYSAVDMFVFAHCSSTFIAGVDMVSWANVQRWFDSIWARPTVQRGLKIPVEAEGLGHQSLREAIATDDAVRKREEMLRANLEKAREMYGHFSASGLSGLCGAFLPKKSD